jgi:molecular chaperone DnaK
MALQRWKKPLKKQIDSLLFRNRNQPPYVTAIDVCSKTLGKKITRAQFDWRSIIERCLSPCEQGIERCSLSVGQIDEVIMVGGSTRIPKVGEIVEKFSEESQTVA